MSDDSSPTPSDSADDSSSNEPAKPTSSPLFGCIILVVVVVIFASLATLFTVVFHKQAKYWIDVSHEAAVAVPQMTPTEDQIRAADEKLEKLRAAAAANQRDRFLFSADDLNTLIASKELLADFRGQTFIKSISKTGIEAEMCQQIRSGFLRQGIRFFHGTFWLNPEMTGKTILFRVVDIQLPGKEVPDGLVGSYPAFMKLDPKMEPFDEVLPKIGAVYLEEDQLVVETRVVTER